MKKNAHFVKFNKISFKVCASNIDFHLFVSLSQKVPISKGIVVGVGGFPVNMLEQKYEPHSGFKMLEL